MREKIEKITVDFYINQKPTSISFFCPYCESYEEVSWNHVTVPEYWGDDWGWVDCPYCGRQVKLGDYDFG